MVDSGGKTVVVVPTYNERENLAPLAEGILSSPLEPEMIVVDDASSDGTGELADALASNDGRLQVIHRPRKLGVGSAHIAGFKGALAGNATRVITMDADFSHHPRYLPALAAGADRAGLVIGSRYVPGGRVKTSKLQRKILSRGANLAARLALGLDVRDATGGFRCYRREALEAIDLDAIFSEGYSFLVEILYQCRQAGFVVEEVPIVFEDREKGISKISRREIARAVYTVLRLGAARLIR